MSRLISMVAKPTVFVLGLVMGSSAFFSAAVNAAVVETHADRYEVLMGDKVMGEGVITLKPWASEGCWHYHYNAKPRAWLRWITGEIREDSWFCESAGQLKTQRYRFHRDGVGADRKNYSASFDWREKQVTITGGKDNKTEVRELEADTSDKLLLQLIAAQQVKAALAESKLSSGDELRFPIIAVNRNKDYVFTYLGEEIVQTKQGPRNAVRIDRIKSEDDRISFWLDPARDMRLLRADTVKDGRVFTLNYLGAVQ